VRFLVAVALAGCGVSEPTDQPSWQVDVMPILAANCVRCHGYPTNGTAPPTLRLDSYADTEVAGNTRIQGAALNATLIAQRIRYSEFSPDMTVMPPGRTLPDRELTVLRNWAGLVDGSMRAPRGPGRADNATPQLTLIELERTATQVSFAYELRDADRDLVVGSLRGPQLVNMQLGVGVIADLVTGRDTFTVDLTGIPSGTYDLVARLDDGADIDGPDGSEDYVEVVAGSLVIAP
jgi:hypothetical protein